MNNADRHTFEPTLTIKDTQIRDTKSAIAIGGGRRVLLSNISIDRARHAINCVDHGGPGLPPGIQGAQVRLVKSVFLTSSTQTAATVSDLTLQDTLSLGQLGAPASATSGAPDTIHFQGGRFTFANAQELTPPAPAMNFHLLNFAVARFLCCVFAPVRISADALDPPVHLINRGLLTLERCVLGGQRSTNPAEEGALLWVSGPALQCLQRDCRSLYRLKPGVDPQSVGLSRLAATRDLSQLYSTVALRGAQYVTRRSYTPAQAPAAGAPSAAALCDLDVQVSLGDSVPAWWSSPQPGQLSMGVSGGMLQVGDLVISTSPIAGVLPAMLAAAPMLIGRVRQVSPVVFAPSVDHVILEHVPLAVQQAQARSDPGPVSLALVYHPRIHAPTTGRLTIGSSTVGDLQSTVPLDRAFAAGHRVQGVGIAAGSYVVAVDAVQKQLTLSRAAIGAGLVTLRDADFRYLTTRSL